MRTVHRRAALSSKNSAKVFGKGMRVRWEGGRSFGYAEIWESWIHFTTVPRISFMILGKSLGQVFRKISSVLLSSLDAKITSQTFKGKLQPSCYSPWKHCKMNWPLLNAFKYPASTVKDTHIKVFRSVLHFHTYKILCSYFCELRRTNL